MSRFKLFTPKGVPIVGMAEMVPCLALVYHFDANGDPDYAGTSQMDWDNQQRRYPDGERYEDADGHHWRFEQLTAVAVTDDDEVTL